MDAPLALSSIVALRAHTESGGGRDRGPRRPGRAFRSWLAFRPLPFARRLGAGQPGELRRRDAFCRIVTFVVQEHAPVQETLLDRAVLFPDQRSGYRSLACLDSVCAIAAATVVNANRHLRLLTGWPRKASGLPCPSARPRWAWWPRAPKTPPGPDRSPGRSPRRSPPVRSRPGPEGPANT